MKTKQTAGAKKQTIVVKDLKTSKNPKGGACGEDQFLKRSGSKPSSMPTRPLKNS